MCTTREKEMLADAVIRLSFRVHPSTIAELPAGTYFRPQVETDAVQLLSRSWARTLSHALRCGQTEQEAEADFYLSLCQLGAEEILRRTKRQARRLITLRGLVADAKKQIADWSDRAVLCLQHMHLPGSDQAAFDRAEKRVHGWKITLDNCQENYKAELRKTNTLNK